MKNKNEKLVFLVCILLIASSIFVVTPNSLSKCVNESDVAKNNSSQKTQLSFAAFADTHIGARYQYPWYQSADHLDKIGEDLTKNANLLDFAINLGDIINHNAAQVNGVGLPFFVNQYKNNLKAYHISNINLPFHLVLGNHDLDDYEKNKDNPHNLTKALIDETSLNNPVYAMMRDGILFLIVPELGLVQWTHPVEYLWVEYMTSQYHDTTTIILSHQAIEDTTKATSDELYRAKQDIEWWTNLFQNNPQIKMWIHGHNHYLDWYLNNKSTGDTSDVQDFGHTMAFSAPYSQLDFARLHEEDRIVIYNISSNGITTATWENNGFGGHWVDEYIHSWEVDTTFDPDKKGWYSFPMFLQDNETQLTDMKILSPDVTLQLIGTEPMELFYDSKMESPSSRDLSNEMILGFGNDRSGNVEWADPGMKIHGSTTINFPEKYPIEGLPHEDGRSGPLYQSFPMGTICSAVPGQTYEFRVTAKSISGSGRIFLNVSCSDWETNSQYSILSGSSKQVFSHIFGTEYETITGTYTVPSDENVWFLQGELNFIDPTDYDMSLFSVKRKQNSDTTDNFNLFLGKSSYNVTGSLDKFEYVNFSVNPQFLSNADGVMNFTAYIDGNRYGMVNLVYYEPLLMSRNARFRVNSYSDNVFNLSLTKTITRNSPVNMRIWNSEFFQKFPIVTEFIVRFMMKNFVGRIFDKIISNCSTTFKMFPFSTDPIYEQVTIMADDGSVIKHISDNGNLWFSCNGPQSGERYVEVTLLNR